MPLLVMKFGGTSVATLDRIKRAAKRVGLEVAKGYDCLLYTSPSPRDGLLSRMPSSA